MARQAANEGLADGARGKARRVRKAAKRARYTGELAEDIVQTALMRTARHWRRARRNPEAYARQVVVNLAKDRWRHLRRRAVGRKSRSSVRPS